MLFRMKISFCANSHACMLLNIHVCVENLFHILYIGDVLAQWKYVPLAVLVHLKLGKTRG